MLHLDVQFSNAALNGLKELTLPPLECISYVVQYSPATTGCRDERYGLSVAFYFIVDPLK